MNTHADKTQENKSQSVAHAISQKQNSSESIFQFVDNRPETIPQRKLQDLVNNSPQAKRTDQLQAMADNHSAQQHQPIQKKENNTELPNNLKTGIENLSGYSMDDVKIHYNSDKPAQLNVHAYSQGTDIHLASGQEKHLPHEGWHVVQQKQGRVKPTMQMKGKVNLNDDARLEKEPDVIGAKAQELKNISQNFLISNDTTSRSAIQLAPINDKNPKHDLLYRNFRFLLSEMIELKRDGVPQTPREELLLGGKYKHEAEELISEMWLVSNDFKSLGTQLSIHLMAKLSSSLPEDRYQSLQRRIDKWVAIGELARFEEQPALESHSKERKEERKEMSQGIEREDWWTTCKYACVRAASKHGAGGWAYQLADFLPLNHDYRGDPMALFVQPSEYVTKAVWMERMRHAANMIALAAQNSGATHAAFFKKNYAYGAERVFTTHIELKISEMPETASLLMTPMTTASDVEAFILEQLGL